MPWSVEGIVSTDAVSRNNQQQTSRTAADRAFDFLSGREHQAASGITAIDLLYDLLRMNPSVIEAAGFARATGVDDMARFLIEAQRVHALAGRPLEGSISNLQGYVAERMVAHHLIAMGADVEFPEVANYPGVDIFVNGAPYQVKCLASPDGIAHHLSRYPDIPVFCNEELAVHFSDNPFVRAIPGLHHDQVREITTRSLDAGVDILNLEIPVIAFAITAAKGGIALLAGRTDLSGAVQACITEGTTRLVFAAAGKAAAPIALAAFSVGGGWPLVVAPFVASAIGYRMAGPASDWLKRNLLSRGTSAALMDVTRLYLVDAAMAMEKSIARLEEKRRRITTSLYAVGGAARDAIPEIELQFRKDLRTKKLVRDDLRRGLQEPRHLEHIYPARGVDPLLLRSSTALRLTASGGLFPENIGASHENLIEAAKRYDDRLERLLVSR
jgi:hypothetical protein